MTVDLSESTLVDEFTDGLEVGFTVGNVRGDQVEHGRGSLGQTNENTVVDLEETEKDEDLSWLGGNLVDTDDDG